MTLLFPQPDDITVTIRLRALDQCKDEEDGGIEIIHSEGPGFKASLPELWLSGQALGSQNAFHALAAHLMERRLKRLIAEKLAESLRAHISHDLYSSRTNGRWQKRSGLGLPHCYHTFPIKHLETPARVHTQRAVRSSFEL